MELTVTQENLSKALSGVSRVASNKAGLQILNNILLRTDGVRLLIAATNLEIATVYHIGSKIITPGDITVPSRLITEFIASLPSSSVDLKVEGNKLHIKSGRYSSTINGIVADDFPELPTINDKKSTIITLGTLDFKKAISQTIISASTDNTRPVLTGVFWQALNGNLVAAATDGYRLSEKIIAQYKGNLCSIIPATTLQEVMRSVRDDLEEVEILFDETQVRFRLGGVEITSRLIDGKYPDYQQLIPKTSEVTSTINTAEFIRVVKVAALFARSVGGSITIAADGLNKTISISSIASEFGENTSIIEAEVVGDGKITLNSKYLSDALSVIDSDDVIFRFSGKVAPCVVEPVTKSLSYRHIIMPLKS